MNACDFTFKLKAHRKFTLLINQFTTLVSESFENFSVLNGNPPSIQQNRRS
jgi:hypothetical protein